MRLVFNSESSFGLLFRPAESSLVPSWFSSVELKPGRQSHMGLDCEIGTVHLHALSLTEVGIRMASRPLCYIYDQVVFQSR